MTRCPICSLYDCKKHSMFTEEANARNSDPDTSHAAAASMVEASAPLQMVILAILAFHGDLTCREACKFTDIGIQTISPRFVTMRTCKYPLIEWTGEQRAAPGKKRKGNVYRITPHGGITLSESRKGVSA